MHLLFVLLFHAVIEMVQDVKISYAPCLFAV